MFSATTVLAAMLAMAPMSTNAHMFMRNPLPYGSPNNSPLEPDGSNFPCRGVPYARSGKNDWAVGSKQRIVMEGSAVHKGGSCQVSVTTDKEPTKSSKWKVIHSVHGGCPTPPDAGEGNYALESGALSLGFDFMVPPELPNGDFSMAWTWFNRVGNREMYMFCAPVTVTGGAKDQTAFDTLPDMAIANIAGQGTCKTTPDKDYEFENPGKYVSKGEKAKGPFEKLCGGAATDSGAPGIPQQSASPGTSSQASANPSAPAVTQSVGSPQTSTLKTVITVTGPSRPPLSSVSVPSNSPANGSHLGPAPPQTRSQAPAAPGASQVPVASQAPAASQVPAAPAPGGITGDQPCYPDGSIVCSSDGNQFGICDWGKAVMQPVARGTTCKGGKISRRSY